MEEPFERQYVRLMNAAKDLQRSYFRMRTERFNQGYDVGKEHGKELSEAGWHWGPFIIGLIAGIGSMVLMASLVHK